MDTVAVFFSCSCLCPSFYLFPFAETIGWEKVSLAYTIMFFSLFYLALHESLLFFCSVLYIRWLHVCHPWILFFICSIGLVEERGQAALSASILKLKDPLTIHAKHIHSKQFSVFVFNFFWIFILPDKLMLRLEFMKVSWVVKVTSL